MKTKNTREKHMTKNLNTMNAEKGCAPAGSNGIPPTKEDMNGLGRILKRKELLQIVGLSSAQLYRNIKAGLFPPPYAIGQKSVGWKQSDIQAWMDSLRPANTIKAENGSGVFTK